MELNMSKNVISCGEPGRNSGQFFCSLFDLNKTNDGTVLGLRKVSFFMRTCHICCGLTFIRGYFRVVRKVSPAHTTSCFRFGLISLSLEHFKKQKRRNRESFPSVFALKHVLDALALINPLKTRTNNKTWDILYPGFRHLNGTSCFQF